MRIHGRVWWFTYRALDGNIKWENSELEDQALARQLLAQKVLPRARLILATLEAIADGKEDPSNGEAGGPGPTPPGSRRGGRKAAGVTRGIGQKKRGSK